MATLKSIGRKIAQERVKQRLTQEDLAGMAEIDRSFLSYIENGRNNFSVEMLLKICKELKINPQKVFE
jgi:transcriptional regulator with XRE-family HTH domain